MDFQNDSEWSQFSPKFYMVVPEINLFVPVRPQFVPEWSLLSIGPRVVPNCTILVHNGPTAVLAGSRMVSCDHKVVPDIPRVVSIGPKVILAGPIVVSEWSSIVTEWSLMVPYWSFLVQGWSQMVLKWI